MTHATMPYDTQIYYDVVFNEISVINCIKMKSCFSEITRKTVVYWKNYWKKIGFLVV